MPLQPGQRPGSDRPEAYAADRKKLVKPKHFYNGLKN